MYPFNTFLQLAEFCRYESYQDTLGRYKLVAIPFIGPKDRAVRNALKYHFERLHISTGKHFACISFGDPPLRWKREHPSWMNRPWMRVDKDLSANLFTDEGRIDTAFRDRFDLPSSPCLLLTDNLGSNHYVVMPVNEMDLVQKLEAIGRFTTRFPRPFPINDPDFESFLSCYDSVYVEKTIDGESIARNITDVLAVDNLFYSSQEFNGASEYVRNQAQGWVDETLNKLLDQVNAASGDQLHALLRRYLDYFALTLGTYNSKAPQKDTVDYHSAAYVTQYSPSSMRKLPSSIEAAKEYLITDRYNSYLTQDSLKAKDSYNCLLSFVMLSPEERNELYPYCLSSSKIDYSALGLYMGEIVEEEMNASVVQLARMNSGIKMPTYYRLWDESNRELPGIKTNNGYIFLNGQSDKIGKNKYKVKMLGIGQAALAIRLMRKANPEMEFGPFGEEAFLSRMGAFSRYRNKADHPLSFGKRAFLNAYRLFSDICENDLAMMAQLKRTLKK